MTNKLSIILFFLTLCFFSAYTQDLSRLDSLLYHAEHTKSDTLRVRLYNSLVSELKYDETARALTFGRKAVELAKKIEDKDGLANGYDETGTCLYYLNKYEDALDTLALGLKLFQEMDSLDDVSSSYNRIGNVHSEQGNYPKAIESYTHALKISEKLGDRYSMASPYGNLGNVYADQGQHQKAIQHYLKAYEVLEEFDKKRGMSVALNNIGAAYYYQKTYDSALIYCFAF